MARQDNAWLEDNAVPPVAAAGIEPVGAEGCTCEEFRRDHVCDHVLMAAAVRMVRRMIDIHTDIDSEKPH